MVLGVRIYINAYKINSFYVFQLILIMLATVKYDKKISVLNFCLN